MNDQYQISTNTESTGISINIKTNKVRALVKYLETNQSNPVRMPTTSGVDWPTSKRGTKPNEVKTL